MKVETLDLAKSFDPKSAAAAFVSRMKPESVSFAVRMKIDTRGGTALATDPRCNSFEEAFKAFASVRFDLRKSFTVSGVAK